MYAEPVNSGNVRVSIELVTPGMADELLTHNIKNRDKVKRNIEHIANELADGAFRLNGETIKLAEDGTLLDGQNRLIAISKTGVSAQTIIVRGLPNDVMPTIDTGIPRRFRDILDIQGEAGDKNLAAVVKLIYQYEHGFTSHMSNSRVSHTHLLECLDRHRESKNYLSLPKWVSTNHLPKSMLSFLLYAYHRVSPSVEWEEALFNKLVLEQDLKDYDPIYTLRQRLRVNISKRARPSRTWMLAISIKALNASLQGRTNIRLKWDDSEPFPEVMGWPPLEVKPDRVRYYR